MQSGARAIAIVVLQSLLAALAFAGDANKPATNPNNGASETASASEPQAQATPAPTPKEKKEKKSSSAAEENNPRGEVFFGYSYVRFNTSSALVPGGPVINQEFDMIPGAIGQANININ